MDPKIFLPNEAYNSESWTTNYGAAVWDNQASLTVGNGGPILLEDYHLIEKLSQFDRERIPERVVHAVGATAKGYFECTADISHLTMADPFREVGAKTPLIVRFSTVVHSRGSPETLRDPRGFAVKFYTKDGNWDLVGNNMPVFFIRDGHKFPDMVHCFKPNPRTNLQEWWRIWDFLSHHPESCHMLTWLLDDMGVPQDYRHMEGFGVHTFKMINRDGVETYVKFHWKPVLGMKNLCSEEDIASVQGRSHNHAMRDLHDAIESGDFPEYVLNIQTMNPEDEDKFDFDPLDPTKTWPEDQFPLMEVGKMVLNSNPDNFFTENEQVAFCPSILIPGIYPSEDKLLQTRLFSYADTQRYRLGANYLTLPVNAPKCKYHNNHHDGPMAMTQRTSDIDYFPSRYNKVKNSAKYPIADNVINGKREKTIIKKENNFKQAGERFRSWDYDRQERFLYRAAVRLAHPKLKEEVREIWLGYWTQCDKDLGSRLAKKLKEML